MKYASQVSNNNDAHVVAGVVPEVPTGTVRCRAWRLRPGGLAPVALTLGDPNDVAQAFPAKATHLSFDLATALEAEAVGSFQLNFPQWEERAVVIEFYDDGNVDNTDICKIVFGGNEDQTDDLTGTNHLGLQDLMDAIQGKNLWSVMTGYNYADTDNQATDTITFTPFLLKGSQTVNSRFVKSASISVFAIDGSVALFSASDNALSMIISPALGIGDGLVTVDDTTGVSIGDILAVDDELVEVTNVNSGTVLAINRGYDGTIPAAHGDGSDLYRSAADQQGVFRCQKLDTTSLVVNTNYSLSVSISYKDQNYTGQHQFLFLLNDV